MDRKRLEIIITSGLILVLLFAWANATKFLKKRTQQRAIPSASILLPSPKTLPIETKEEFEDLVWVRDPFSGKVYTAKEGISDLKCDGIIWDEKSPLAMINGRIVKIGDRVAGSTVVDIKPDRVILNDGTKDFELR